MTRVMMHSDRDRRRGWERRGDERGRDRYGDRPAKRARREGRSRSRERRRRYEGGGDERREQRQQRRYDGGRGRERGGDRGDRNSKSQRNNVASIQPRAKHRNTLTFLLENYTYFSEALLHSEAEPERFDDMPPASCIRSVT